MVSKKVGIFMMLFTAFAACKKEEATQVVADNQTLLTTGKWKMTTETTGGVDTYKDYLACEKDNTFAYGTDGKVTFDEGATKCNSTDAQTTSGTWAFSGTEKKKVILTQQGFSITSDIIELTTSSLKWSFVNPFDNKTVIQTYGK